MIKRNINSGFKYNKKGNSAVELATILIILFIFAFGALAAKIVFVSVNDDMQVDDTINSDVKDMVAKENTRFSSLFDGLFLFLFFLLWGLVLVSAFMLDAHPIFFIFTIIILIFVFIIAVFLANTYDELVADGDFNIAESEFPITYWFMTHYLLVAIVMGFSIVGTLFAKNRYG